MELAPQLAGRTTRAIGEHYGVGPAAVGAVHRRLSARPETLEVVKKIAAQLRRKNAKIVPV